MVKEITPVGPVNARVRVPGSKSITNRALICAALADGDSTILNASESEDTALMANGLNQLGVLVTKNRDTLVIGGTGGRLFAPKFPIPVGNAGTTLRFMISLASLARGEVVFQGHERMGERPVGELLDALGGLGVRASAHPDASLYRVHGGTLRGGIIRLRGDKSSQFLSSLLMVSSYAMEDVSVEIEGNIVSMPYVEMTMAVMKQFGVLAQHVARGWTTRAGQRYKPTRLVIEPDATGASYFLAAAAVTGGNIVVEGLSTLSLQGDSGFLRVLKMMGCGIEESGGQVALTGGGRLRGISIDMNSMPDVVPTLAVLALFAEGGTRIRNVGHLRYKESDRLTALATELRKVGAEVRVDADDLEIVPAPLHGALLETYDDHRLAMSFALIGLRVPGVKIENPGCVRKSFPAFWAEFEKLRQSPGGIG